MSLAKYLNRFTTIHHKILTQSTGTPKQFAAELHISESRLLEPCRPKGYGITHRV